MSERFPHHRLEAYRCALRLAVLTKQVADRVPRGYRCLAEQLLRSGVGVALLVAEGANRFAAPQKRQRFVEARGECGEAAATVEVLEAVGLVAAGRSEEFVEAADRVAAMLTGLISHHS